MKTLILLLCLAAIYIFRNPGPGNFIKGEPLRYKLLYTIPIFFCACSGKGTKEKTSSGPPVVVYKKEKDSARSDQPPIINLVDTLAPRFTVLCIKDSASTSQRMAEKLSDIYNKKLKAAIDQNKLVQSGPRMAWYRSSSPPFYFEAGIPVNKKPGRLPKKMHIKTAGGDSALIAHFYGPYELTFYAYDALRERMNEKKKKSSSPAYEVYVTEPYDNNGKFLDPYKVRTDIILPYR